MSQENLSAIVGLHDSDLLETCASFLEMKGYSVDKVVIPEAMLAAVKSKEYQVYVMDPNLGKPGSEDISAAIEVYELVRARVEKGDAKFVAISGNPKTIKAAEKNGIPIEDKMRFSMRNFLKEAPSK